MSSKEEKINDLSMQVRSYLMKMKAYQDLHSAACLAGDFNSAAVHAKAAIESYAHALNIQEEQYVLLREISGLATEKVGRA